MRGMLKILSALVAAGGLIAASALPCAGATSQATELPIRSDYCEAQPDHSADCARAVAKLKADNVKAWKGNYGGQRNVSYCLSTGCGNLVAINKMLGCAWRIVIIGSGSSEVDVGDIANIKYECGRLDPAELSVARGQAAAIFQAVYKRSLPAVSW